MEGRDDAIKDSQGGDKILQNSSRLCLGHLLQATLKIKTSLRHFQSELVLALLTYVSINTVACW